MSISFEDHDTIVKALEKAQADEQDARNKSREDQHFVHDEDGMWEEKYVKAFGDRPRYTFDLISPQVDETVSEIEQNEFQARVDPLGSGATKEVAKVYSGIIRNIQVASNASRIFQRAGRKMTEIGFDAWRIIADYESERSFKQIIKIQYIENAINRVWFDSNAVEEDRSDARFAFDCRALNKSVYEEKFPNGKMQSLDDDSDYFSNTSREVILVGEILYKKSVKVMLVELSDGSVIEKGKDINAYNNKLAQLAEKNITPVRQPTERERFEVKSRWFDRGGWLTDEADTPFRSIPIAPVYGNFDVVENDITYRGKVRKAKDANRVFNYSESRQIEEGAIAPREKIWVSEIQADGYESELEEMNTSPNPVQLYKPDPKSPAPYKTGGATVNPSLAITSQSMATFIQVSNNSSNDPNRPAISGVALKRQENKGNSGNIKYHNSLLVGIRYTCRVLIETIPIIFDTKDREVRIVEEDGTTEVIKVNTTAENKKTGVTEPFNDLERGVYDVTCSIGAAFKNRQEEAIDAQIRVGEVLPETLAQNADIFLSNISAPGMDLVQERVRKTLFEAGKIPESQWTEEERAQVNELEAAQEAEAGAAGVDPTLEIVAADTESLIEERANETERENAKAAADIENDRREQDRKDVEQERKNFETLSKALKHIREGAGIDTVISPEIAAIIDNQVSLIDDSQESLE